MKKKKIIIPGILLTSVVTATIVTTNEMIKKTFIKDKHYKYLFFHSDTSKDAKDFVFNHEFEELEIQSFDGLSLKGHLLRHPDSNKLFIGVHGYRSNNFKTYSDYLSFYYNSGYNIFIPNNRAHGNSEGKIIGFGWLDRLDVQKWIDYLIHLLGNDIQIVLQGNSMGSATVLMLSGEYLPDNVKCIISDCGYTNVYDEIKHTAHNMNPFIEYYILPIVNLLSKKVTGYNLKEASTLQQVKKSKTPTLFIHGEEDTFVPTYMVYDLYNACNAPKDLLIIKEATHDNSYKTNKKLYEQTVTLFLNKYVH